MKKTKNNKQKILALATAALALPGMTPKQAIAQAPPENSTFSYRFSEYTEGEQLANTTNGDTDVPRYDIDVHQFRFETPLGSEVSFSLDAAFETMTGASPWFIVEGDNGEAIQVMSGATIEEKREDITAAINVFADSVRIGIGVSESTEKDYRSQSGSFNGSIWINNNNTTLDFGLTTSVDEIKPTQDPDIDPNRPVEEDKSSNSISVGMSQNLDKNTVVAANFSIAEYSGFLSDPYKFVSVNGAPLRDNRPSKKEQYAVDLKLRRYINQLAAAFHSDYRFYDNDWGATSHTLSFGWFQNIGTWQASTQLRWYDQKAANFYEHFYTAERADGFYSSDYRLSAYSATSYKLGLSKYFDFGRLNVTYENYSTGKGIYSDDELNPGLIEYELVSAGIDFKF